MPIPPIVELNLVKPHPKDPYERLQQIMDSCVNTPYVHGRTNLQIEFEMRAFMSIYFPQLTNQMYTCTVSFDEFDTNAKVIIDLKVHDEFKYLIADSV